MMNGTQADLGRELDAADKTGTWFEVRNRWQGKKLRWTVTRQSVLCASADSCNVAAFPVQQAAAHGWMPELRFAAGQFEALAAKCGGAEQCDFTFEGVLARLEASDEAPTRLRFTDVKLVETVATK